MLFPVSMAVALSTLLTGACNGVPIGVPDSRKQGDGEFRFAAQRIYSSMVRRNQTVPDLVMDPGQGNLFCATTYGLICGARGSGTTASGSAAAGASVCGPGWADPTIDPTPPPDYDTPSSVVHTRREPAGAGENHLMADKIVLAQSKAHAPFQQDVYHARGPHR